MRNSYLRPSLGGLFFVLILTIGCQYDDFKEIDGIEYNADFAIPLINSKVTIQEIIDETEDLSLLEIDADGNLTFMYNDTAASADLMELIEDETSFPLAIIDTNMTIPFDFFSKVHVRSINLKGGSLFFNLSSSFEEQVNVTISIPDLRKNGVPFSTIVNIDYNGTSPSSFTTPNFPLDGYVLDMPDGNLHITYDARLTNGDKVTLNTINGEAQNWQIADLKAIWDKEMLSLGTSSVSVDLYDSWVDGELHFEDPQLSIIVDNSFGFPASILIKSMYIVTLEDEIIPFVSDVVGNTFEINYPELNEIGSSKSTSITFNKDNSNIATLFNTKFKKLIYELEAMINPDEETDIGFLAENSKLVTYLDARLPVYGTAKGFELESISDVEMDDVDNIRDAEFKLITDNGLPVDIGIQLYFLDDTGTVIDSLFNSEVQLLESANIDANGEVSQSTQTTELLPVNEQQLEWLRQYGKIRLDASLSTFGNGNTAVRIQNTQELDVKLGLKIGVE